MNMYVYTCARIRIFVHVDTHGEVRVNYAGSCIHSYIITVCIV